MFKFGRNLFEKFTGKRNQEQVPEQESARLLEEAKTESIRILNKLRKTPGDYSYMAVGEALCDLNQIPNTYFTSLKKWTEGDASQSANYQLQNQLLATYLADEGYVELFVKIATALQYYVSGFRQVSQGLHNLDFLCTGMLQYSQKCEDIRLKLVECDGINLLIQTLASLQEGSSYESIIQTILLILYNCRNDDTFLPCLRKLNAVEVLEKCTVLRTVAVILIAKIGREENAELLLQQSRDCVGFFVGLLREAYHSKDHVSYQGGPREEKPVAFSLDELLDGLDDLLSISDDNKREMHRHQGKKILDQVIVSDRFGEKEKKLAIKVLRSLAFVIEDKNELEESKRALRTLQNAKEASLRLAGINALREIERHKHDVLQTTRAKPSAPLASDHSTSETDFPPSYANVMSDVTSLPATNQWCGQVLISYESRSLERVLLIKERLRQVGYKVWMDDLENDSIEVVDVFLMCMSEEYKNDSWRRTESNYAKKLNKNIIPVLVEEGYYPDGWLQQFIGKDNYYRFCSEDDLDSDMTSLLKAIKDKTVEPTVASAPSRAAGEII